MVRKYLFASSYINMDGYHETLGLRFYCEFCTYGCDRKSSWDQHIRTAKHNSMTIAVKKANRRYICPICESEFKHSSSHSRHKKICKAKSEKAKEEGKISVKANPKDDVKVEIKEEAKVGLESPKDDVSDKQLIMMLIKQNAELMEMLKNGTMGGSTTNNINTNTNCNNKAFNLNVFLNETCKNAMNISEFMDSIQVQLKDLERFGEVGYVEGISNIITNNLKQMDITERPVHCTDQKRETIYIKDDNKWEKEDDNKSRLRRLIKRVETKNFKLLPAYREKYPGCQQSDSKHSNKYNKMMVEVTGGAGDNDLEKQDKIIRNISKNVFVDK